MSKPAAYMRWGTPWRAASPPVRPFAGAALPQRPLRRCPGRLLRLNRRCWRSPARSSGHDRPQCPGCCTELLITSRSCRLTKWADRGHTSPPAAPGRQRGVPPAAVGPPRPVALECAIDYLGPQARRWRCRWPAPTADPVQSTRMSRTRSNLVGRRTPDDRGRGGPRCGRVRAHDPEISRLRSCRPHGPGRDRGRHRLSVTSLAGSRFWTEADVCARGRHPLQPAVR